MSTTTEPVTTFEEVEGRGSVDYLIRNTQQHLVQLSAQADLKANIIVTASAVILSVGLTKLTDDDLRIGITILTAGSLAAFVLAILAALPRIDGARSQDDQNPLYFIDAASMSREEFRARMAKACQSDAEVYALQVDGLHAFSRYLKESKYRRVRLAYLALLFGIVSASVYQVVDAFV